MVRSGSTTHRTLTSLLAQQVSACAHKEVAEALRGIVATTPHISTESLKLLRQDIEINTTDVQLTSRKPEKSRFSVGRIPQTIHFDLDDQPTLIISESSGEPPKDTLERVRRDARLRKPLSATVIGPIVEFSGEVRLPIDTEEPLDVFIHWGRYEDGAPPWQDELATLIPGEDSRTFEIKHRVYLSHRGIYGATLYVQPHGSHDQVWLGRPWHDDLRVEITTDDRHTILAQDHAFKALEMRMVAKVSAQIATMKGCEIALAQVEEEAPHLSTGELLARVATKEQLHALWGDMSATERFPHVTTALANFGIGELVFATPEGPHAAAGGLAQVITGLPPELCKAGLPVSIITPLYAYENGSKHGEAQSILREGLSIGGIKVRPRYLGDVAVPVGPTHYIGSGWHCRQPSTIPVHVYLAQHGKLRYFLLANSSIFDRVYQPVFADEQLRRSIILSRAVLETLNATHFGIRPHAIISNDWMTACIPSFAALDPRYTSAPWKSRCKTIHMIHNGGADYHGRLPVQMNREDLWPLLGLQSEHFFGFKDPYNSDLINLTMAAAQHVTGGILTVSKTYAQQLLTPNGGDGLEYLLQTKPHRVAGISNGINRQEIDRYLRLISSSEDAGLTSVDDILRAKASVRASVQQRFHLNVDPQARIISFVGRLAEQKGLHLLSGFVAHANHSALEDILLRHPDVQLIIAGPSTPGDRCAQSLRDAVQYLTHRYPGRVGSYFSYISHSAALETIFASHFFLMPSRFEPGGLTQLESLAAATLVVGRNVGGIAATIDSYNPEKNTGNGFLFDEYSPTALANTTHWALKATRDVQIYRTLCARARDAKHAWSDRVEEYRSMLKTFLCEESGS
jgi:starch synthase